MAAEPKTPAHAPVDEHDALWVAMSADGALRARAVRADHACHDAVSRHALSPLAAHALSRGLLCVALVPLASKRDRTVSLQWTGGGPLGSVFAEARPADGTTEGVLVRGTVKAPRAEGWAMDPRGRAIGRGLVPGRLRILRQANDATVAQGEVELYSGELDEDLEHLFQTSEQVPTRVRVAVALDDAGQVRAARGLLVQALPGAHSTRLDAFADHIAPLVTPDAAPEALLAAALGADVQILEKIPLAFSCPCSRQRALGGVALLDRDEVIDMIAREGGTEVRCEMCGTLYKFTPEDLLPLVETHDPAGPGEA